MASDADRVEDARRWYFAGRLRDEAASVSPPADVGDALGYEAAYPALQTAGWPDAPASGATSAAP